MMLVGMTPSTHDGRRKLLTGVDGGELAGKNLTDDEPRHLRRYSTKARQIST